jgi:hypothetical protein
MRFTNSNVGGAYSVSFTAHVDSAWADNPIGFLLHLFIDVFGVTTTLTGLRTRTATMVLVS